MATDPVLRIEEIARRSVVSARWAKRKRATFQDVLEKGGTAPERICLPKFGETAWIYVA